MFINALRHFIVAFGALTYLMAMPLFLYQYLGLNYEWPGVFLNVVYDTSGDWWLDINWYSPVIWSTLIGSAVMSVAYAAYKRHDLGEYREPNVQSQPGF
jgi:hypothetical protein